MEAALPAQQPLRHHVERMTQLYQLDRVQPRAPTLPAHDLCLTVARQLGKLAAIHVGLGHRTRQALAGGSVSRSRPISRGAEKASGRTRPRAYGAAFACSPRTTSTPPRTGSGCWPRRVSPSAIGRSCAPRTRSSWPRRPAWPETPTSRASGPRAPASSADVEAERGEPGRVVEAHQTKGGAEDPGGEVALAVSHLVRVLAAREREDAEPGLGRSRVRDPVFLNAGLGIAPRPDRAGPSSPIPACLRGSQDAARAPRPGPGRARQPRAGAGQRLARHAGSRARLRDALRSRRLSGAGRTRAAMITPSPRYDGGGLRRLRCHGPSARRTPWPRSPCG